VLSSSCCPFPSDYPAFQRLAVISSRVRAVYSATIRVHSRQTRASSRLCDEPAAVLDGYTGGVIGVGEHQRSYSQPSVAVKRVASNFANNKKHFIKECHGIQLWGEDTSSGPHLKRSSRRWLLQHSSRPI